MTNTKTTRDVSSSREDRFVRPGIPEAVTSLTDDATSAPTPVRETASDTDYSMFGYNLETNEPLLSAMQVPQELQSPLLRTTTFDDGSVAFSDFLQGGQGFGQSSDIENHYNLDPFSGFDIPFWFEQDQYWDILQNTD
jgi:hypothetical protein